MDRAQIARELDKKLALVNNDPTQRFAFFTILNSKLAMPLNREVVCLDKLHICPIG
jgi:hypothetical protein